jgi:succinoglycan biosynthesis protein ExoA
MMTEEPQPKNDRCVVVIPCLNEAQHIRGLLQRLKVPAERLDMQIVVADGGSADGTLDILGEAAAANPRIHILHNEKRIQSAAVNLAIAQFGDNADYFIRLDAHGDYPEDYCDRLIEEARSVGAASVVVAMATKGSGLFQEAAAFAQNSKLGNGGSKHRQGGKGRWIDHGHHALMRVEAFRAVGGYDETFSHNEDAELDHRLGAAGYRIWLTDKTVMTYYPRSSAHALFRQYFAYGRGRAMNLVKHRTWPKIRQMLPLAVVPLVGGTSLALIHWTAALPVVAWAGLCIGYGVLMGIGQRSLSGLLAGLPAMIMHLGWSAGFWAHLIGSRRRES